MLIGGMVLQYFQFLFLTCFITHNMPSLYEHPPSKNIIIGVRVTSHKADFSICAIFR